MDKKQIEAALTGASQGVARYADIMDSALKVNVALDKEFQRQFNGFYRIQRRPQSWYSSYYDLMQKSKSSTIGFDQCVDRMFELTGRYEASFASKLVATLNPELHVWDKYVLENTEHAAPSFTAKNRLTLVKDVYRLIGEWYVEFLASPDGALCVRMFDEAYPKHKKFTALKKVDFILWQIRR
jgi:hypothetical protein